MGLFSRSKQPRPAPVRRAPAPRVRLRPEEIKRSNQLTTRDRQIGTAAALYGVAAFIGIGIHDGWGKGEASRVSLGVGLAIGMIIIAWRFSSRIGLSIAAVAVVMWISVGWPTYSLVAYPLLALMLYLMLAMSNARRRIMKERIDAGDFADPRSEARAARAAGRATKATNTPDGRPIATPSKRYTPPKAASKKR
jgi:membrane protein implicated in regulation of membrane protease activity